MPNQIIINKYLPTFNTAPKNYGKSLKKLKTEDLSKVEHLSQ